MARINNAFGIKTLKHIVLMGAFEKFEEMVSFNHSHNIRTTIITSPAQENSIKVNQETPIHVFECLDEIFYEFVQANFDVDQTLFISFRGRWPYTEEIIHNFLAGNLINFHGTRLPLDAGGGGFSWMIMRGDRIASQLVHLIDEGLDTGDVLMDEQQIFPRTCILPIDYETFYREGLFEFYTRFIAKLLTGEFLQTRPQTSYLGRFNPRLNTDTHAFIDWDTDALSLWRFITAFDDPYPGASTFWNNQRVQLKHVHMHGGETPSHPFMRGLVMRHHGDWLVVASAHHEALLVEQVLGKNGNNIINEIKAGDRFYTPRSILDNALASLASVTALANSD